MSAILLTTLIPIGTFGHPHVFIDNSISIVFDEHGLAGFGIEWAFDEMFSAMIIHNYDRNKNGKFEAGEIEEIKKGTCVAGQRSGSYAIEVISLDQAITKEDQIGLIPGSGQTDEHAGGQFDRSPFSGGDAQSQ